MPVSQILEINGKKVTTSDEVPPEYDVDDKVVCRSPNQLIQADIGIGVEG